MAQSADDLPGGNIFKQAWVTITSFFGSFLSSDDDEIDETTGLTRQQKTLIKKSWSYVQEDKLRIGVLIFIKLFKAFPSSQQMFDKLKDFTDMEELARNKKMKAHATRVMAAFTSIVEYIDQPDILDELLRNTSITHYKLRMPPHYFEDLGGVIIEALSESLGDKFTQKTKEAWLIYYSYMCKVMLEEMELLEPSHDDN
ncbi:cytoglobin-1-like isoform X1 [Lytechinus pictus]|uniref:cytoglobin-1-like isoform X1 n=1 Tax=Lytechinus pictus TaxID=7653 RepID=UPI0030B9C9F4